MGCAIRVLALLLAVGGCAPQYETRYRLEPPADTGSAAVQRCLSGCTATSDACIGDAQQALAACEDRATLRQSSCQNKADIDFQLCQATSRDTGKVCVRRFCYREQCQPAALRSCEADYRRCFAACGGKVVEERRCVANCPS
ncbi:hypothetical protein [Benzoatithermus flavus]|uniref:Lipoprotein n=1 Tax=Benzoatithermus flavus TaxID=3108223 RepID=A0ABU8XQT7_9PROT